MSNIYQVARKFLLKLAQNPEVESKLLKHLGPENKFENPIYKELINRGIIPIISNKSQGHTAVLGQGAYNTAYEVSYKGRRAVAKVTTNKSDHDKIRELYELKNKVGSNSKYIVNVYDYFETKDRYNKTVYVIVVETLIPLNSHLRQVLFEGKRMPSKNVSMFSHIKQEYDYLEVMEVMNTYLKQTSAYRQLPDKFKTLSLERADSAFQRAWHKATSIKEFWVYLKDFLNRDRSAICGLIRAQTINDPSDNWKLENDCYSVGNLFDEVNFGILRKAPLDAEFPYFHIEKEDPEASAFLHKPETKDFLNFLYQLKKEHGIRWADLHQENIMMRPGTLDLVISDPGLFRSGPNN